jgi:hypothetical protein
LTVCFLYSHKIQVNKPPQTKAFVTQIQKQVTPQIYKGRFVYNGGPADGVMADPAISYFLFRLPESGDGFRVIDDLKKTGKSNTKYVFGHLQNCGIKVSLQILRQHPLMNFLNRSIEKIGGNGR